MCFPAREKIVNYSVNKFTTHARHIGYTLAVAIGLSASGVAFLSNNEAGAMGGGGNPAAMMSSTYPQSFEVQPSVSVIRPRIHLTARRVSEHYVSDHRGHEPRELLPTGLAMCVRLCDGSFFPSNTASGGDAACNAQCPDAPTALYMERPGAGSIEDAVSTSGALYSNLPVAGRYQTVLDSTCTCHRERASYSTMLLRDPTLRKGDAVMTPKGVVVYAGTNTRSARPADFVALAQENLLSGNVREDLAQMRSTPIEDGRLVGYSTAASPSIGSPAARKGSIWIDSPSASSQ